MIGICTKCSKLYDFGSEEQACEPNAICRSCWLAARHAALDELAAEGQRLGLYDVPTKENHTT